MTDAFGADRATPSEAVSARSGRETPRARFLDAEQREEACRALAAERALVVRIESIGASARGRLASVIEEAIERELDARGAAPPGIGSASDADAALSDQLFRARRIGATGIALALGRLRAATSPRGALEPEDGEILRFWAAANADRPVWLFLDTSDAATGTYEEPVALAAVLDEARAARCAEAADEVCAGEPTPTEVVALAVTIEASPALTPPATAKTRIASGSRAPSSVRQLPLSIVEVTPASPEPVARPLAKSEGVRVKSEVMRANDEWRPWVASLTAARGPQSLAAFERLFARDYMPLANAIAAGLDDTRALQARDEFQRTFARAYTDASPAFAVTGKRPRMVLDAPDVAARIARLHGARSTQILLVDAMRFDIGATIRDATRRALGARASLTDELVLWSALPTTTLRQLETLQRGPDALRVPPAEGDRELDPLRGRTAEVIRRVKVGSRDLYKLDVIEARVRDLGDRALGALLEIADLAADAIVRHALTLQPRTLLFVFGDHGFAFDRDGTARQGGASPEEVLVPAFALLMGDVH